MNLYGHRHKCGHLGMSIYGMDINVPMACKEFQKQPSCFLKCMHKFKDEGCF